MALGRSDLYLTVNKIFYLKLWRTTNAIVHAVRKMAQCQVKCDFGCKLQSSGFIFMYSHQNPEIEFMQAASSGLHRAGTGLVKHIGDCLGVRFWYPGKKTERHFRETSFKKGIRIEVLERVGTNAKSAPPQDKPGLLLCEAAIWSA